MKMASSASEDLQEIADALRQKSSEYINLQIKINKTKVMRISRDTGRSLRGVVNWRNLQNVDEFSYLGSVVTIDERCTSEIRRKIAISKKAFTRNALWVKLTEVSKCYWLKLYYGALCCTNVNYQLAGWVRSALEIAALSYEVLMETENSKMYNTAISQVLKTILSPQKQIIRNCK